MGARRPGSGVGLGLCGLPAARAQTCCSSDHVCAALARSLRRASLVEEHGESS